MQMKTFLAIDFGTTQSSVARFTDSSRFEPEIVDIDGQKAVATALQLDSNGNVLYFGKEATEKVHQKSGCTFYNFKVEIGTGKVYRDGDKTYTPEELSLIFLTHLRQKLERRYFNGVKLMDQTELSCIIGCPAEWTEVQKKTVEEIAQKAGFPRVTHCEEPWGIIYYYHFQGNLDMEKTQNVLVYDFGGGTTDLAIECVHVDSEKRINPDMLAAGGITDLGGMNFDRALAGFFMKKLNLDPQTLPPRDHQTIERFSKLLKEELSRTIEEGGRSAEVSIPLLVSTKSFGTVLSITEGEFQSICGNLMERFEEPIYDVLNSAKLMPQKIDRVILAGGSSVMPYVRERVSAIFPKEKLITSTAPTEVVAKGLAIYGRVLACGAESLKIVDHEPEGPQEPSKPRPAPGLNTEVQTKSNTHLLIGAVILLMALCIFLYMRVERTAEQVKAAETLAVQAQMEAKEAQAKAEQAELQAKLQAKSKQAKLEGKAEQAGSKGWVDVVLDWLWPDWLHF